MDDYKNDNNQVHLRANSEVDEKLFKEIPIKDFSYTNAKPLSKKPKPNNKPYLVLSILIIIVLLAFGGYTLLKHKSSKVVKGSVQRTTQKTNNSVTPTAKITSYNSTNFNLSVNYPSNWIISDTTSVLSLTSPETSLTNANNQTVQGRIILSVSPKGQLPSDFGSSAATAVLNSQLVSYTSPTPAQDAQTYISFLQYGSTTIIGGLNGIYVTGNYGYLKGQNINQSDIQSVDPLVRVSFEKCSNNCKNLTPLVISASDWSKSSFSLPIINIIKSFQFS